MTLDCSIEILRSPEVVFPWIAEPKRAMKWQKNVKGGEVIVSTPQVVGTTFTETLEEDGSELVMEGTITDYAADRLIAFHLSSRIHEFDVSYALEATERGVRVSISAVIRWKFPMNVVTALTGKRFEKRLTRQLDSELRELKAMCEST